jgi:hypothetical protein
VNNPLVYISKLVNKNTPYTLLNKSLWSILEFVLVCVGTCVMPIFWSNKLYNFN